MPTMNRQLNNVDNYNDICENDSVSPAAAPTLQDKLRSVSTNNSDAQSSVWSYNGPPSN